MRRTVAVLALVVLMTLLGACSKAKDTGFPSSGSPTASAPSSPTAAPQPVTEATIVAKKLAFDLKVLVFKANSPIKLTLDNQDAGMPHNFSIYNGATPVFRGDFTTGPVRKVYDIPALKPGTYRFQCDAHTAMAGTVTVQ